MGPLDSVRFVHTAIAVEAGSLEHACTGASPDDLPGLGERVALLARVVDGHTHAEEPSIFPALEERAPHVAATYLSGHVDGRELFATRVPAIATAAS